MGIQGLRGTLGIMSRVARHKEHRLEVESGGSGRLSRWTCDPRRELQLHQTVRLRSNATPHKYQLTEMTSKGKGGDVEGYPGGLNGSGTANYRGYKGLDG